ncbi:MAG TPA: helix-turn-helix domain-containing protein [Gemmatimonadales bacterium]|nr:helix-turn-helix domain-containing protein [Gemmatimonadales bacterium]
MKSQELPDDVRNLIRNSIPTLEVLEPFMGLVRNGDRAWTLGEVASLPAAQGLSPSAVARFLTTLEEQGLLQQTQLGQ